jgi:hypothetical protein
MLGLLPPKRPEGTSNSGYLGSLGSSGSLPGLRTLGLGSPLSNLAESTMMNEYLQTK